MCAGLLALQFLSAVDIDPVGMYTINLHSVAQPAAISCRLENPGGHEDSRQIAYHKFLEQKNTYRLV